MSEILRAESHRPPHNPTASTSPRSRQIAPPRTDVGTIILHWATVGAFLVSLFTGIRIAADALNALVSHWLSPILPQGEIWTWHFLAGLTLFFCMSSYLVYVNRSALTARNALQKIRLLTIPAAGKMRFEAVNVGLHWLIYAIILVATATGIFLYLGFGGWLVWIHSTTAFIGLSWIFVHIVTHYLQGGWWQIFRLFRPAKLIPTRAIKPLPLLIAIGAGLATIAVLASVDWATRDTLIISRTDVAPVLDGKIDEDVWARARPVSIRTASPGTSCGSTR